MVTIRIDLSPKFAEHTEGEIHLTIDENGVVRNRHNTQRYTTVFNFMNAIVNNQHERGRWRTAETYKSTLSSFRRFRNDRDILLAHITPAVIEAYEMFLKTSGLKMNTISFYMRILRAAYNRAVKEGLTQDSKPFRNVYTGIGKTQKRAVSLHMIHIMKDLRLNLPSARMARDMFLFSFYTRGMSFVDMAFLKKTDLQGETLIYKRKKTGQTLKIKWEQCMQDIIDRHGTGAGPYLLPIINKTDGTETRQYRTRQSEINRHLKNIGQMLELEENLTMYVARHSWASIAKKMNIPLAVISDSMGHHSLQTTQIYLAAIDSKTIDNANKRIIRMI